MKLSEIHYPKNARKDRKRVGRGEGSGLGKTSGRGHKGQMARSGATHKPWFEGGQMPLQRRLPKRGFSNINRRTYQVVNVSDLVKVKEQEITAEVLQKYNLVKSLTKGIKLLGDGLVDRPLVIKVQAVSQTAKEKVEKAGGKIELIK
jgi:large subunit ribosomal protein L15